MSVTYPTKQILAYKSGNRCALPDCGCELSPPSDNNGDPINLGEAAHIIGEHGGRGKRPPAARYDPSMSEKEKNHYNNLLYVCRNCHQKIDSLPQGERDYPVERLRKIKTEHEQKVREALIEAFSNVGFPELEEATQWILSIPFEQKDNGFELSPVKEKLKKNHIADDSLWVIAPALSCTKIVRDFIQSAAQTDVNFPERLKTGFLQKYYSLKQQGHRGDDLFNLMCQFSQQGSKKQSKKSAGLAVLVYLFEACEVFEK